MSDVPRTVADVFGAAYAEGVWGSSTKSVFKRLGIDPDMSFDQFRRRLAMGERAEHAERATWQRWTGCPAHWSWNALLDYIRGDDD